MLVYLSLIITTYCLMRSTEMVLKYGTAKNGTGVHTILMLVSGMSIMIILYCAIGLLKSSAAIGESLQDITRH